MPIRTIPISTKARILKEGRALLQLHGYNGFSFQDIADRVGIQKGSLFDHFGSKDELIVAILKTYVDEFRLWCERVRDLDSPIQIQKVFDIFFAFASDRAKVCPVLALVIDPNSLSKKVRAEIEKFIGEWLRWLEARIQDGQKKGLFRQDLNCETLSRMIYAAGMGSQLQARVFHNPSLTREIGSGVMHLLKGP